MLSPFRAHSIVLSNDGDKTFEGFLLKCNAGRFIDLPDGVKFKDCVPAADDMAAQYGGREARQAVGHSTSTPKSSVTVKWEPPAGAQRSVRVGFSSAVVADSAENTWHPLTSPLNVEVDIPDTSIVDILDVGDHCTASGLICTNCISPQAFGGLCESGEGGYSLAVDPDYYPTWYPNYPPNLLRVTLSGPSFKGFMLKTSVGVFEWLPDEAIFKDCSGDDGSSDESPGGTGAQQTVVAKTDATKTQLRFQLLVPPGTTSFTITTIVLRDSDMWFGWVAPVTLADAPPSPADSGGSGSAGASAAIFARPPFSHTRRPVLN